MAERWALCRIVGTGADSSPYRPRLADYAQDGTLDLLGTKPRLNWAASIPSTVLGHPVNGWALCHFQEPASLAALNADADVFPLPAGLNLNALWTSLTNQRRTAILSKVQETFGFAPSVPAGTTIRQVLRQVGQRFEDGFNEDRLRSVA
jgi:hypothetical protein